MPLLSKTLSSFLCIAFLSSLAQAKVTSTPEVATKTEALTSSKKDSFFALSANSLDGKLVQFSTYRGQVVLVVNTASQCGFTPQLKALEGLYQKYKDRGFTVLAFPSNDFKQEKGSAEDVQSFATKEYGCTFPFFEKAPVSGPDKQAIYQFLTDNKPGIIFKDVAWNFEKFLIGRDGRVIDRWVSITKPDSKAITQAIEKALAEPL